MANHEQENVQRIFGRSPRASFNSMTDWEDYINDSKVQPKPKDQTTSTRKIYSTSDEEYARAEGAATRAWYYKRYGVDETPVQSHLQPDNNKPNSNR